MKCFSMHVANEMLVNAYCKWNVAHECYECNVSHECYRHMVSHDVATQQFQCYTISGSLLIEKVKET